MIKELIINPAKETDRIVDFLKREFGKAGFSKAIIGISGGIDSAVVANLLVRALGADNVLGVQLPCGDQKDILDSQLVIDELGIPDQCYNISVMVKSFKTMYKSLGDTPVTLGNIKARCRMIILYDLSATYHSLVVGTGNKTEMDLGYFTMFGDGACAMEPISHLYKTQVKELAKYLGVPDVIINKAPSAGLWDGQTDEEELGHTYDEMDEILYILEENRPILSNDTGTKVFASEVLDDIANRLRKNAFKTKLPASIPVIRS